MLIKSKNHDFFYCISRIVYERLKNGEDREVVKLPFSHPDSSKFSPAMIDCVNGFLKPKEPPAPKPAPPKQLDMFS